MSKPISRLVPGQLFMWGTILAGLWAAFQAGNIIGDDGYAKVFVAMALLLGVIAVLTVREYWWIPAFVIGPFAFSTGGLGFNLAGADLAALFGFTSLIGMLCMGQLRAKNTQQNLGIFFYLTLFYGCMHTLFFCVDNYYNGDTQLKNIIKRYYAIVAPLILLWCMDRYARGKELRKYLDVMITLSVIFSLVGIVLIIAQVSIPIISGNVINFEWASDDTASGYLRWALLPMLLLCLSLISSAPSEPSKRFYQIAFCILLPASFFGGGRIALLMILTFIAIWMMIRKKWKELFVGGWIVVSAIVFLLILGRTIDARQLQSMPRSLQNVQRAISILLPSDQVNDDEVMVEGSNQWHEDLARGAWDYANESYESMILGNGFKGWDDSIDINLFTYGENYDFAVKTAIHMGQSETMFFSVLPILGWVGVLLYYGLMIELMRRNLKVMRLCPEGSLAKSLCEYSFCLILTILLLSPVGGSIPGYNMILWMIGFIAAEQYIQKEVPQKNESLMQRLPMQAAR